MALTYIAGGSVAPWKEGVTAAAQATGQWGTWDDFEQSLYAMFTPIKEAAVAAIKVHHLDFSQFDTVDNFNAKFFCLCTIAGIREDILQLALYKERLPEQLCRKICLSWPLPQTMVEWAERVLQLEHSALEE